MDNSTLNAVAIVIIAAFLTSGLTILIAGCVHSFNPVWLRCPRCKIRMASIKVASATGLSPQAYRYARDDMRYRGDKVCSSCWEELEQAGFVANGNWALGAIVEYLKDNPNWIGILIAVGALVVSIMALSTSSGTCQ